MTRMLAIDVEGDGQKVSNPVQIALSELDDFRPTGKSFMWKVKPPGPISYYATRVHGIRNADVATCPPIETIIPDLRAALGSDPIVGHGIRGDYVSIKRVLPDWDPAAGYDTFRLTKNLLPTLSSYKLAGIGDALGLTAEAMKSFPDGAHDASFDALLAGLIAHALTKDLQPKALRHALTHSNIFNFRAGRKAVVAPPTLPFPTIR